MRIQWKNIVFNIAIALNCLLLFLLVFGAGIKLPALLQVAGRMHPLMLHFPIVLLIITFVWELFIPKTEHFMLLKAGDWLLLTAAFTAALAALMGFFLSNEGGYDEDTIALHKWTGVLIALICMIWYAFRHVVRKNKAITFVIGFIGMIAIILAGHQGATITHGENFLLAPVTPENKRPTVLLEDAVAYAHLIKPILEEKCISCHNRSKAKGELVMETEELLLKGGKNGKLWDTTAAGFGLMMKRIHLPADEKEHMPPKGKMQLVDEEINALYFWIKNGASFTKKVIDYPETDSFRTIATTFFKQLEDDTYNFATVDESSIKKLNTDYRLIHRQALNSPALGVDFFSATVFKPEQLKELDEIKNNIVSLNLNKMPVKDADIKLITVFKNLKKLNLSFTDITGSTLNELIQLKDLRQLSLSGTKITAAHLASLKGMEKLNSVYLWNTGVSETEIVSLKKQFTQMNIESGFRGDTVIARLGAPIIEGDERVFSGTAQVKLKHYLKGVVMRYTLDGSEPDSLGSPLYNDKVVIDKPVMLKAKAFLPGWISSEVTNKKYFKIGFRPDSVKLVTPPSPAYKGNGIKTIADGEKGELDFRTPQWVGYKENNMVAYLYFTQPIALSSVSFSSVLDIGSYIMPAQQLEVWGGTNLSDLKLLSKINPKQPAKYETPSLVGFDCYFPIEKVLLIKLVAKPVAKLPAWHQGKGQNGWFFIDEVFLN
jgi:uncharacterized membrane protein